MLLLVNVQVHAQLLNTSDWQPDILNNFEDKTFTFTDDYEGAVTAHLIRKMSDTPTNKAVLYIHGFVDYFYQEELANQFNAQGYNFYAIELRKYGRSLMPHQHPNFMKNVAEYYEEIDASIDVIKNEDNNETLLLNAHSTGGLIGSLYLEDRKENNQINAAIFNSPFLDINDSFINLNKRLLLPSIVKSIARKHPYQDSGMRIPVPYGQSLHTSVFGEWDYNLDWKPIYSFPIYFGWMNGILQAQKRLQHGLNISVPVLVMYSSKSSTPFFNIWRNEFSETDIILDIKDIDRVADVLSNHITEIRYDGGLHDLTLSKKPVRDNVYKDMMIWANAYMEVSE